MTSKLKFEGMINKKLNIWTQFNYLMVTTLKQQFTTKIIFGLAHVFFSIFFPSFSTIGSVRLIFVLSSPTFRSDPAMLPPFFSCKKTVVWRKVVRLAEYYNLHIKYTFYTWRMTFISKWSISSSSWGKIT